MRCPASGFSHFVIKVSRPRSNVVGMRDEALTVEILPGPHTDTSVLRLTGPVTLSSLFPLKDAVGDLTSRLTILDMSQVRYVDSAGLGTILMFHVSSEKNGRKLALAGVTDRVLSRIRMTRIDAVLSMFPSVEAAEQSASQGIVLIASWWRRIAARRLEQFRSPQIVQVDHTFDTAFAVDHNQRCNFALFHATQGLGGKFIRRNRQRIRMHGFAGVLA